MLKKSELVTLRNPIATARYGLTVNQQKAFLEVAAYFKANPDQRFMRLYVREFLNTINVRTNALAELIEDIKMMMNITINIPLSKQNRRGEIRFLTANIFASAEFQIDDKGIGYIEIEVSDKLKPYMIEVINGDFFSFKLPNTRDLKSSYSIKIYMLLKSWRRFKKLDIAYMELRDILNIEKEEYKLFGDFKRRILDKAQGEILEKTDMKFNYTLIRAIPNNSNSEVSRIVFAISDSDQGEEETTNTQLPLELKEKHSEALQLIGQIDPKISKVEASEFLDTLDLPNERLMDILIYAKEEQKRGIIIRSLFAYIIKGAKTPSMGIGLYHKHKERLEEENRTVKLKNDHAKIKTYWNREFDDYKTRCIYELGVSATIERKNGYYQHLLIEISQNPTLKKVFFDDNNQLIQDAARAGLGYELYKESMNDDQLFIKYMLEEKKQSVYRIGEYWTFAPLPEF